jgi:hypothetical protein
LSWTRPDGAPSPFLGGPSRFGPPPGGGPWEKEFDLILGIARGGLILTALLRALSVRDILTAAVMFHGGEETLPEPVFLPFPPDPLLFGKRGG